MHWFGNLYQVEALNDPAIWLIATFASLVCGALIGLERERREKPAGLRTLILICVGSTIFTIVSAIMATKPMSDPARVAAQIVTGIGFLGAGAIIRDRGTVHGLTTGATIWAVAAVGMTIGCGQVALGIGFSLVIFLTLTVVAKLDWLAIGACRFRRMTVLYRSDQGKARIYIQAILDEYQVPDARVEELPPEGEHQRLAVQVCCDHREHRAVLKHMVDIPAVDQVEMSPVSVTSGAPTQSRGITAESQR